MGLDFLQACSVFLMWGGVVECYELRCNDSLDLRSACTNDCVFDFDKMTGTVGGREAR